MGQRYLSGEEIHIGDRVQYGQCFATILLVVDREEWPAGETEEGRQYWRTEWKSGFLLKQDPGARLFLPEADEDLTFVSRGPAPEHI
jgi:hypothetical protein